MGKYLRSEGQCTYAKGKDGGDGMKEKEGREEGRKQPRSKKMPVSGVLMIFI